MQHKPDNWILYREDAKHSTGTHLRQNNTERHAFLIYASLDRRVHTEVFSCAALGKRNGLIIKILFQTLTHASIRKQKTRDFFMFASNFVFLMRKES